MKSQLPDNFLWGGAVAAHQLEGGWDQAAKGVSVVDVLTAGAHGKLRKITDGVLDGEAGGMYIVVPIVWKSDREVNRMNVSRSFQRHACPAKCVF